jgi:hypothetical protein
MDRLKAGWLTKLIGDIAVRVYFELDSIGALVMLSVNQHQHRHLMSL